MTGRTAEQLQFTTHRSQDIWKWKWRWRGGKSRAWWWRRWRKLLILGWYKIKYKPDDILFAELVDRLDEDGDDWCIELGRIKLPSNGLNEECRICLFLVVEYIFIYLDGVSQELFFPELRWGLLQWVWSMPIFHHDPVESLQILLWNGPNSHHGTSRRHIGGLAFDSPHCHHLPVHKSKKIQELSPITTYCSWPYHGATPSLWAVSTSAQPWFGEKQEKLWVIFAIHYTRGLLIC